MRAWKTGFWAVLIFWGLMALWLAMNAYAKGRYLVQTDNYGILQSCLFDPNGATPCFAGTTPDGRDPNDPNDVPYIMFDGSPIMAIEATYTGTISGRIEQSMDQGANWLVLGSGSDPNTFGAAGSPAVFLIKDPIGWYRTNVLTCTKCTYLTNYRAVPRFHP